MKNARLIKFTIRKIDFVNCPENNQRMEIGNTYSYNVGYAKDNTCKGEFSACLQAKGLEDKFHINVVAEGIFEFNPNVSKDYIHVETYDLIFPYVSSLISNITVNAGINPIIPPYIDITNKEIYSVDLGNQN